MKILKKTGLFLVLVFSLMPIKSLMCEEYLSGVIIDHEGNITKITKTSANNGIRGKYKGKKIRLKFSELKKIEYLGNDIYRVTNLNNKHFNLEDSALEDARGSSNFFYSYFDEISLL